MRGNEVCWSIVSAYLQAGGTLAPAGDKIRWIGPPGWRETIEGVKPIKPELFNWFQFRREIR